ncbi:MAG TPA: tryptophan 7-halogenase, partial [Tepidisphaeraceae bacterium]|nr:tryptophan 7-halogenase [Tepidisphaeraceae bacterium]
MKPISDVLVVGDDCDGLLAAINLKIRVPQLGVQVLRHSIEDDFRPEGLATSPAFVNFLHEELGVQPLEFLRTVRPTWRLGTRYEWGPREFFDHTYEFQIDTQYLMLSRETGFYVGDSPRAFEAVGASSALMSRGRVFLRGEDGRPQINLSRVGYHIERESLLRFLETLALRVGVTFREGEVTEVIRSETGVACIEVDGGELLMADLFIDATGRQSLLLGQALNEPFWSFAGLLCDRALVATWPRQDELIHPHSAVHTMEAGWSWRTEHERFLTCGYAFSSSHINARQAQAQLRQIYPECGPVRLQTFVQGRRENAWSGNVVGIANASAFVEPLAAAGPATLAFQCQWLARTLVDCERIVRPSLIKQYNKRWRRLVDGEREFLGLFYRYNTRQQTPFWQEARKAAYVGDLEPIVRCYQDIGPDSLHRSLLLYESDPFGLEGYFSVLLGQNVPWTNPWRPPAEEVAKWPAVE